MSIRNFIITKELISIEKKDFLVDDKFISIFNSHILKLYSILFIQSAFRVADYKEYMECYYFLKNQNFFNNIHRVGIYRHLRIKNIVLIKICSFPLILRATAFFAKILGVHPY